MAGTGIVFPPGATGNTYADEASVDDYVQFGLPLQNPRTPGVCEVTVEDKEQKVDEKKASGATGGRLTTHGIKPGKVQIKVLIWTKAQDEALFALKRELTPDENKKDIPVVDVSHPVFTMHRIRAIQVLGWKGPSKGPHPQSWFWTIDAREYLPLGKKNVVKTDEAPKSGTTLDKEAHPTPEGANP